ncbi:MAG: VCBS repeat-containing protein, partial [Acidobacteria bacterium]|nr:VCBS repeat-containing protein [Acidobacteriota bacterium]
HKWDVAVFRPSSVTFYILQSATNALRAEQFGANGDAPVAAAFVR